MQKVYDYMEQLQMFMEGDYVVAGISGGADSICLLLVLLELRKKLSLTIHVVHINHGIRQEAGEDAAYVAEMAGRFDLPFTLIEADVESLAEQQHCSTEEAGRHLRYESFERVLAEHAGKRRGRIAIAHNKNDYGETFLFHLFRGSGLKGLSSIRPVRGNIVRPLLCVERKEIEAYLADRKISYCIDATNLEDTYTRNKIRHHILPYAESQISQGSVRHIWEAGNKIADAYALMQDLVGQEYENCVRYDMVTDSFFLLAEPFGRLHTTLQGYLLMELLGQAAGANRDLEEVHVAQLGNLMTLQCGRKLPLPYGLEAVREYDGIRLYRQSKDRNKAQESGETIEILDRHNRLLLEQGETIHIEVQGILRLECCLLFGERDDNFPQKTYTKWFDYDKIKDNIVLRTRCAGDYLTVNDRNQHKTLKAYFIDEKVPAKERGQRYLVAEGSHVMWIIGNRISNYYKVSEKTSHIIQIKAVPVEQAQA